MIISGYLRRFGLRQFIETETHLGDTLAYFAHDKAVTSTNIELADGYYREAKRRFASDSNVNLMHSNSRSLLQECVRELREPAHFWLDGHYSGGATAKDDADTPISAELAAILAWPIKNHVVLIDYARCFAGTNGYPCIGELPKTVRDHAKYDTEMSAGIILLTQKDGHP